jgi:hypothetical protein
MRRVFVFGAGASKSLRYNAPLMSQLIGEIVDFCIDLLNTPVAAGPDSVVSACPEILTFIAHMYASPLDRRTLSNDIAERRKASRLQVQLLKADGRLPNLEDILSQIDYALAEDRPLSQYWSVDSVRKLRRTLVYAMARVIGNRVDHHSPQDLSDPDERLIAAVEHNTVISLNYDLTVDNLIQNYESFVDYGIAMRGIYDRRGHGHGYEHYHSFRKTDITLLKLHGSLNWLYCPRCREIDVTQSEKGTLRYIFEQPNADLARCPVCDVPYEPVIITPTFLKSYESSLLRQLWERAEIQLESAQEVIFVGYSLPDADIMLRSMFTRALAINRMNERPAQRIGDVSHERCKISLVDFVDKDDPESVKRGAETRGRYERLFGKIDDGDYYQGGLASFI